MNFWSKYNQTTTRFNYLFKVSWIWRKKKYDTRNKVSDQYWPLCKIICKVVYLLNFLLFSCVHLLLLCHVYVKLGISYLNSNRARYWNCNCSQMFRSDRFQESCWINQQRINKSRVASRFNLIKDFLY